eukprot:2039168-Prymnesium_polylepis.1
MQAELFIRCVRASESLVNGAKRLYNRTLGQLGASHCAPSQVTDSLLNGPAVMRLLCDVAAHQVFVDGVFNTDPHAGNIIYMPDGRLGLIDYGACATVSVQQREALARILVAISDWDRGDSGRSARKLEDDIIAAAALLGMVPQRGSRIFVLGYALLIFHRGPDVRDLQRIGVPPHVPPIGVDQYLSGLDAFGGFDPIIIGTSRLIKVLLGLSMEIGVVGFSISHMWRPHAQAWLSANAAQGGV